jgi:hypothetical protein
VPSKRHLGPSVVPNGPFFYPRFEAAPLKLTLRAPGKLRFIIAASFELWAIIGLGILLT